MALRQGEGRGEAGAEVAAVDVHVPPRGLCAAAAAAAAAGDGRGEVGEEPGVSEGTIMGGGRPAERGGSAVSVCEGRVGGPAVVDGSEGAGGEEEVWGWDDGGGGVIGEWARWEMDDEGVLGGEARKVKEAGGKSVI